jgi:hypothetical protein
VREGVRVFECLRVRGTTREVKGKHGYALRQQEIQTIAGVDARPACTGGARQCPSILTCNGHVRRPRGASVHGMNELVSACARTQVVLRIVSFLR